MTFKPEIILGPPGTGKTTTLLGIVAEALDAGTDPSAIGFVAFTKKAATEAISRAEKDFGFKEKQLPYFRTLHSLAFRILNMKRDRVLAPKDIKEFGNILGLRLTGYINSEEGSTYGSTVSDRALFMSGLSRLRNVSLEEQFKLDSDDLLWHEVERIHRGLREFKDARGLKDFTDMLEGFVNYGEAPDLELLVVDEAQDLSALQWKMVMKLAKNSKRVVVAGDDDQAIFQWAGADIAYFVKMAGAVTVLNQSYRIPKAVQDTASNIIGRVTIRRSKQWSPRKGMGKVIYHTTPESIDMSKGSWLILARNSYLLDGIEGQCRREGFIYERNKKKSVSERTIKSIKIWEHLRKGGTATAQELTSIFKWLSRLMTKTPEKGNFSLETLCKDWGVRTGDIWHEAFVKMSLVERSYMTAALRQGEKITKQPRIVLSTIHSAKGGEADNVILFSDMAQRTYKEMQKTPDNERRVFYVGTTRTKNNLNIIVSKTKFNFSEI